MGFPLMYPRIAVTSADVTNRLMPGRFQRGTSPPLGNPQVSRRGFYSGRQSLELTGATHPRFRAASEGDATNRRAAPAEAQEQRSGNRNDRARAAAIVEAETIQGCCAELPLPVLPSERERKYIETMGFYARSLPTFCRAAESRPPEGRS